MPPIGGYPTLEVDILSAGCQLTYRTGGKLGTTRHADILLIWLFEHRGW
jgi:hypothetical protein